MGFSVMISKRVYDITKGNEGSLSLIINYIETLDVKRRLFKISKLPKKDIDTLIELDIARYTDGVLSISEEDVYLKL